MREEVAVAFYGEGDEDLGLAGGCADVEGYAVEVADDLVDGGRRGEAGEFFGEDGLE